MLPNQQRQDNEGSQTVANQGKSPFLIYQLTPTGNDAAAIMPALHKGLFTAIST